MDELKMALPVDKTQIPDVFVYVWGHKFTSKKKRIGFLRIKVWNIRTHHVELQQTSPQATDINAAGVTKWELISPDIFGGDSKLGGGFLQLRSH